MQIELEADIPPPEAVRAGRRFKYPYHRMEVGESFFYVPSSTRSSAQRHAVKTGKQFVTAKETRDGVHGYRMWRIK